MFLGFRRYPLLSALVVLSFRPSRRIHPRVRVSGPLRLPGEPAIDFRTGPQAVTQPAIQPAQIAGINPVGTQRQSKYSSPLSGCCGLPTLIDRNRDAGHVAESNTNERRIAMPAVMPSALAHATLWAERVTSPTA